VPNGDCRDHRWIRVLSDAIHQTPMPGTLVEAVVSLHAVGINVREQRLQHAADHACLMWAYAVASS
jgi:hypothetical protein